MANEPIDDVSDSLDDMTESGTKAQNVLNSLDDTINSTSGSFSNFNINIEDNIGAMGALNKVLAEYKNSLGEAGVLNNKQTMTLGLLTTAILGTRKSFESLNTGTQLNTFEGQWNSLVTTVLKGGGGLGALVAKVQTDFGAVLPDAATKSIGALTAFMSNIMKSADNVNRMSTAMLAAGAATGSLGNMYQAAGPHLENLNELVAEQRMSLIASAEAASMLPEEMEKNYAALMMVPKALESSATASSQMADATGGQTSKTSMLTAATLLAVGAHRKVEDVASDLKKAYQDYGLVGDNALKFTARMGELSNNLGIDLESVKGALSGAADMFGRFADAGENASTMAEGLATIMNSYSQSLMGTGMTGNHALEVIKSMTGAIGDMNIAQKAFLSAQTGGAGGLMGGFQIEKMMRSGDIAGVMDKVRESMKKQMGSIVTLDDAASSPAAAAQLTKQMMLLKQGPLGQFAKTDQDAYRILEAFKSREQGGTGDLKGLQDDIVGKTMDKGVDFQEKTLTEVTKQRIIAEKQLAAADFANMRLLQGKFTAGAGDSKIADSAAMADYRKRLKSFAAEGSVKSGALTDRFAGHLGGDAGAQSSDVVAETFKENIADIKSTFDMAMGMGKDEIEKVIGAGKKKIFELTKKLVGASSTDEKSKIQEQIDKIKEKIKEDIVLLSSAFSGKKSAPPGSPGSPFKLPTGTKAATPGSVLAQAPGGKAKPPVDVFDPAAVPAGYKPGDKKGATTGGSPIHVQVTGFCLKCKQEIENVSQAKGMAPQAQ